MGAAAATFSTLYTLRAERRRKDAEAAQAEESVQAAAVTRQQLENEITERVLKRARVDMDAMQSQIDELREELKVYRLWSSMLCNQVVSLGQEPVSMPDRRVKP
jgi:chaperonin cofactor prefoldin